MTRRVALVVAAAVLALGVAGSAHAATLYGTVGPGATITLKRNGVKVTQVRAGTHTIVVRDRSTHHNFHLYGYGVNRATTNAFVGTRTWTVRVYRGKTYVYRCDPHRTFMRGSFRAV